jgi:sensor c-di-GMP phosphodiesterase-like protein
MHSQKTVERLRALCKRTQARKGLIMVEATERSVMKAEVVREIIKEIRAVGILVAIDDFGTGYSSLSHLGNLELDFLKIDKSFVDTLGTDAATSHVAGHIIDIGQELKLHIIAEGVETEEQARILHEQGVEFGQGWLFSKPLTLEELMHQLETQREPVPA